jgi:GNAT superfamily N-acetyltransferase
MFKTRLATEADAGLIAEHRRRMFAEMGLDDPERLREVAEAFLPWVRERLRDGRYLGWLVEEEGAVVGGGGMWLMDFPPHWHDPQPLRAYLLNFYVVPESRGQGLAYRLLRTAVEEARQRGIRVVALHASNAGRPIYEKFGFKGTSEMMLKF